MYQSCNHQSQVVASPPGWWRKFSTCPPGFDSHHLSFLYTAILLGISLLCLPHLITSPFLGCIARNKSTMPPISQIIARNKSTLPPTAQILLRISLLSLPLLNLKIKHNYIFLFIICKTRHIRVRAIYLHLFLQQIVINLIMNQILI